EHSEQTDVVVPEKGIAATECTKAFRYLFALSERPYQELVAIEEAPDEPKCSFKCEDKKLQEIFDVSLYTFGLCKKEFILDGVKRDRWTWSGDVYQSALVNYYSHFDTEVVKRSLRALKGKDPINAHINHITDYTLYWILSLCDYYRYTADKEFIGEMLPCAEKYMNFLAGRADEDGFLYYHADDWMFIDWAPMDNRGITSFEQVLYAAALKGYAELCKVCGKDGRIFPVGLVGRHEKTGRGRISLEPFHLYRLRLQKHLPFLLGFPRPRFRRGRRRGYAGSRDRPGGQTHRPVRARSLL
ncbi:MAG: hypothetical protein ACLRL0_11130, partial [Christensenellaceae bacterium]